MNPYKIGLELFRDIEDRWNKGKFGPEWEQCSDASEKSSWDKQLQMGREKIFEVRRIHNDVTFIDEFLTREFAKEHKLFTFEYNKQTREYAIANREFDVVKEKLLSSLSNFGHPYIRVEDANYQNRGELYLSHRFDGLPLRMDYARGTLENLFSVWGRPVHLETIVDKRRKVLLFNGSRHEEKVIK